MTKKDYVLLANAVKDSAKSGKFNMEQTQTANQVVFHIALALRQDNAEFKIDKFMTACGFPSEQA